VGPRVAWLCWTSQEELYSTGNRQSGLGVELGGRGLPGMHRAQAPPPALQTANTHWGRGSTQPPTTMVTGKLLFWSCFVTQQG
jgi:hypothetical protein